MEQNIQNFEIDELSALARLDLEHNRVEQALSKLKYILNQQSNHAEAVRMAARVYAQIGLYSRARILFEQFIAMHPDTIEEKFQLGMVCLDSGQSEQALQIWEDILSRQPIHPPALFYSAVILSRQSKFAEARRNLDVLLQTAPADNLFFTKAKELLQTLEREIVQTSHQINTSQYQA